MTVIPAQDLSPEFAYGKVMGRIVLAVADTSDEGRLPDEKAATGKVTITPKEVMRKVQVPEPATVISQAIPCTLDSEGYLIDPDGNRGVWLITGIYTVAYNVAGATLQGHEIVVTAAHTEDVPLWLTNAQPPGGAVLTTTQYAELSALLAGKADAATLDADVEALAADSASALGARLNSTFAPASVVDPPAGFALDHLTMPTIRRLGGGRFRAELDVAALRPAAGVTYYVAPTALGTGDCTTPANAGTIPTALAKADVGTIVYAPGEYFRNTHTTSATTKSINHLASAPGVKVTGWDLWGASAWTLTSGNIYQTTRSTTSVVADVYNLTARGNATTYVKKADLASITGPGQWAIVGSTVYVWCIGDTNLTVSANRAQIRLGLTAPVGVQATAGTHYFRGIDFEGCSVGGMEASGTALIIAEDCTVNNSAGDGLRINGSQGFIGVRVGCSGNMQDGFGYQEGGTVPDFIEIDCYAYDNGWDGSGVSNCSTSHGTVRGIRVGGSYDGSDGPVVADVNSAKTWNLGCWAGDSRALAAQNQSWRVDSDASFAASPATQWLDECSASAADVGFHANGTGGSVPRVKVHASRATNTTKSSTGGTGVVEFYTA